ncbi:MAG: RNA polymerase sigma factor RpoD/SigA [Lentimicrobiaceae bacterium]|nr:RNA polymerase sigma factor RpoD/SigA [Lentimicrobiaceae bacterium]MBQ4547587.1 RNA polymerase sigma factor RpoD/SigA [Bacteroidales bacterium]MBR2051278.1 RNA polymerase sigma factor RpoD/SigA [Bacteroidales bacterium]
MRQLKISKSITNRELGSLDKYLADIAREEMVTPEEEVLLAQRIREGDDIALERLVKANLRFVVSVAKQYQNQGLSLPDLINEGNVGLIKAAQRFDETKGFKFISYAVWWIRQSILQAVAEQSRLVRLPLNQVGALSKIKKTSTRLEQLYHRQPTTKEIAEELDLPEHKVMAAFRMNAKELSMDAPIGEDEDMSLIDTIIPESSTSTDENLIRNIDGAEIRRSMSILSEKEREILNLYFGIDVSHNYTLEEIAYRLDLTRERVRQIKDKALKKLKQNPNKSLHRLYYEL